MLTKERRFELERIMKEKGYNKSTLTAVLGYKSRCVVTNVLNGKLDSPTVERKIIEFLEGEIDNE